MCFCIFHSFIYEVISVATPPTGGGRRQRIRFRTQSVGQGTILVARNTNDEPAPANAYPLLVNSVNIWCDRPATQYGTGHKLIVPRPVSLLTPETSSSDGMLFALSRNPVFARHQREVIDKALTLCDVHTWPVPKVKSVRHRSGDAFINTGLALHGTASNVSQRHSFNAVRLKGEFGISWEHLQQYAAGAHSNMLGIRTTCGGDCSCGRILEKLWHLGWEMHH